MSEAASHEKMILEYLKTHRGISQREATDAFGCLRLSARIYDLKARGFKVETMFETGVNRFGRPTRYVRYFVTEPKKQEVSYGI